MTAEHIQLDVVRWLADPATHGVGPADVEVVETHASVLVLAGPRVYKLKRAVRYDYLDYGTLERRQACCAAEVHLNRRTAPWLYRGVRAVTREPGDRFALDGAGPVVDWLVEMARFDATAQLDRVAERGELPVDLMPRLARAIARLHELAEWRFDQGGPDQLAEVIAGNRAGLIEFGAGRLDRTDVDGQARGCESQLETHRQLLDARRLGGAVRQCHGDLHLGNIFLHDGEPVLFDGIEFNESLSCIDVVYDLAFTLMDLGHRGLGRHANVLLNEYVAITDDLEGLAPLPLFLSTRAAVRAKTSLTAARLQSDASHAARLELEAARYFALAERHLTPTPPCLVVVGGGSGTGKTTLARAIAPDRGAWPGAVLLRSDVERKRLLGVSPTTRLGTEGYAPGVSRDVYRRLAERARAALAADRAVVLDAMCARPLERATFAEVARTEGVPFHGLWLDAPLDVRSDRIAGRSGDASDATVSVAAVQQDQLQAPDSWTRLDAGGDATTVADAATRALTTSHPGGPTCT